MRTAYCIKFRKDMFHNWKTFRFETKPERGVFAAICQLICDNPEMSMFDERITAPEHKRIFNQPMT